MSPDTPRDSLTGAVAQDVDAGPDAEAVDSLRGALDAFEAATPPTAADSTHLRRWADSLTAKGGSIRSQEPERARGLLTQALRASRALADSARIARATEHVGFTYRHQARYRDALDRFRTTLSLYRHLGDQTRVAAALTDIGIVYDDQGQHDKALGHFREALEVNRELGSREGIARNLNSSGIIQWRQGRYEAAIARFQESLQIYRDLGERASVASLLNNIGVIRRDQGQQARALARFQESLRIKRERDDRKGIAQTLNNIGNVYARQGDQARALARYREALRIERTIGDQKGVADNLNDIGHAHLRAGRRQAATDSLQRAVDLVETLRLNVTSPDARRALLSTQINAYRALTTTHVRSGRSGAALRAVEQTRARLLADRLAGATRRDTAFSVPAPARLQQTLAPDEAALLYANAGGRGPLTAVVATRDTVHTRALPDSTVRAAVGTAYADQLQRLRETEGPLVSALSGDRSASGNETPSLAAVIRLYRHRLSRDGVSSLQTDLARRLHRLLVGPVATTLQAKETVTVVPTGPVGYVPFETLRTAADRYLIETTQVRYAQSLTVLRQLQERTHPPSRRSLLAFGGAAYERSPSRSEETLLASARGDSVVQTREQVSTLLRSAEQRLKQGRSPRVTYARLGYDRWTPLYGTKLEVQKLKQATGAQTTLFTGPAASEEQVRRMSTAGELARYRYVHFATHGVAVPEAPALSALVLSQDGASDSLAARDGYLTMGEIADLRLKADVAVLSACRTGLGRIVDGEGVVSLSHAFLRAGANATLVSQWRVSDWSTQQFMTAVYRRARAEETSFVEAVTQVKRAFIDGQFGARNTDPLRWAPFVYYGRE